LTLLPDRILIHDPADERIHAFTGLTDVGLRAVREPAEGIFVAEGLTVVRRALQAGYQPLSVLATAKWLRLLDAEELLDAAVPRYEADEAVLRAITGYTVHRGVLVLMARLPRPGVPSLLAGARRIVLLEDLKEHTNVGAIIRCCAAFGVDAVITSPLCADPLYRRAVKVSMGTVFQVPWTSSEHWSSTLNEVETAGFELAALTPDPSAADLRSWSRSLPNRVALVFGTEGPGLTPETLARCAHRVRIPMSGGVDSLNVAAAAAVALFALQPPDPTS
jgi:tRNA G18 (ribose-2'-O)-methylase SpoU